jgi:hypothetical protein
MKIQVRQRWRGHWVLHIEVRRWRSVYCWINEALAVSTRRVGVVVLPGTRHSAPL